MSSSLPRPVVTVSPLASSPPSPWLSRLAYPLCRHLILPAHFRQITVRGREHLPRAGPLILAPNHSSRWDALLVPYVAGWDVTGRHLRYMVSVNEMTGLQGWVLRHMGGFPVDPLKPAIASLRHGVELLQQQEALVIFPEGNIFRERQIQPLKPGLARLALQAGSEVQVVPLAIHYSEPVPKCGTRVVAEVGKPLSVGDYLGGPSKTAAARLSQDLEGRMRELYTRLAAVEPAAADSLVSSQTSSG